MKDFFYHLKDLDVDTKFLSLNHKKHLSMLRSAAVINIYISMAVFICILCVTRILYHHFSLSAVVLFFVISFAVWYLMNIFLLPVVHRIFGLFNMSPKITDRLVSRRTKKNILEFFVASLHDKLVHLNLFNQICQEITFLENMPQEIKVIKEYLGKHHPMVQRLYLLKEKGLVEYFISFRAERLNNLLKVKEKLREQYEFTKIKEEQSKVSELLYRLGKEQEYFSQVVLW